MTAMAAPVFRNPGREAVGVITIAGPLMRLTADKMNKLGPSLVAAARELGTVGATSPLFALRRG